MWGVAGVVQWMLEWIWWFRWGSGLEVRGGHARLRFHFNGNPYTLLLPHGQRFVESVKYYIETTNGWETVDHPPMIPWVGTPSELGVKSVLKVELTDGEQKLFTDNNKVL